MARCARACNRSPFFDKEARVMPIQLKALALMNKIAVNIFATQKVSDT